MRNINRIAVIMLVIIAVVGWGTFADAGTKLGNVRTPAVFKNTVIVDEQGSLDVKGPLKKDGVEFSATAAAYNAAAGGTTAALTPATIVASGAISGVPAAGAVGTNSVSAVESYGVVNKTVITFANTETLTDGSAEGETIPIYTFPAGRIYILAGSVNATVINTTTEADTNDVILMGIGTAAANDDADLEDSNEKDVFAGPSIAAGAVTMTNQWEVDFASGADSVFDGTSTAASLNLNVAAADATITTSNLEVAVTGYATVWWINLGDD